jgi:uncharacterized membrane protein AbrB (regulator of aidB expression)
MPLGAFAGGWLADALSVKAAIMIGGLGLVAMAIVTTFIPLDGGPRETPKRSTHDVVS